MVPLFAEVTLMPSVVGCSLRRWRNLSARLMVHPVSAIMQSSSLARSWKGLELETEGGRLQVWWILVERRGYAASKVVAANGGCLAKKGRLFLYARKGDVESKW